MAEIVSGWSDERKVVLVERHGESVSYRELPARWSAFVRGFEPEDLRALQRSPEVVAIRPDGEYQRVEFRSRWGRRDICTRVMNAIKDRNLVAAASSGAEFCNAELLEADVGPLRRLLSDVGSIQIGNPEVCYFDLETDSRKSFDEAREGKARVLSWALVDAGGKLVGSAVLAADTDAAERDLLRDFFTQLDRYDLALAWNGDQFDFPVLRARSQKLKVKLRADRALVWERWCWLDQMQTYKKYNQAHESGEERASFRLDAVARHLLGEGKHDFDASKTWQAWEEGGEQRYRMLRYNEQDTLLLPRIEEKTGYVAMHVAVCQVTRCLPDSASLGAAQQGDGFLLRLGAELGYRFPTKRAYDDEEEFAPFAGAYVMDPKKVGSIDDVHVCDFAGLYPSIMRSWNMSPDTKLAPIHARGLEAKCKLPDRDVFFRTDKRGILALALDRLVAERARYSKKADEAEADSPEWHKNKRLSGGHKVVNNSMYGITGSPFTRFFDAEIAEGVTQTGKWLIKHVEAVANRAGLDAFYGDTDSVMARCDGESFARMIESLNERWPELLRSFGCTESHIKLEYEKSFRRMIMVSKKRYAAKYSRYKGKPAPADMKPEVKGLEFKRGDAIRIARQMQAELIDMLLVDGPTPDVTSAREFVARWRRRVLEEPLALEDVKLSQSVKALREYKDRYSSQRCTAKVNGSKKSCGYAWSSTEVRDKEPPKCPKCKTPRKLAAQPVYVRVARLLAERGEMVGGGARVEYVIAEGSEDEDTVVGIPVTDDGAIEKIDRDYYWDKRVYPASMRMLEVVYGDHDWKDSAARRRKESTTKEHAEKVAANRGKVDDLPLFAGESPRGDCAPAPQVDTPPRRRIRPRVSPSPAQASPGGAEPVCLGLDGGRVGDGLLRAIRAAIEAHPGNSPVTIEIRNGGSLTKIPTGLGIARTREARSALARLVPEGELRGL